MTCENCVNYKPKEKHGDEEQWKAIQAKVYDVCRGVECEECPLDNPNEIMCPLRTAIDNAGRKRGWL